jgi:hypothetical protein
MLTAHGCLPFGRFWLRNIGSAAICGKGPPPICSEMEQQYSGSLLFTIRSPSSSPVAQYLFEFALANRAHKPDGSSHVPSSRRSNRTATESWKFAPKSPRQTNSPFLPAESCKSPFTRNQAFWAHGKV